MNYINIPKDEIKMDNTECNCNSNSDNYFTCKLHDLSGGIMPNHGSIIRIDVDRVDSYYGICVLYNNEIKIIYPQIKIQNGIITLGLDKESTDYHKIAGFSEYYENRKNNKCGGGCNEGYLNDSKCVECEEMYENYKNNAFKEMDTSYKYQVCDFIYGSYYYPAIQKKVDNLYNV